MLFYIFFSHLQLDTKRIIFSAERLLSHDNYILRWKITFAWKLYFQLKDNFRLKTIISAERLLSPENYIFSWTITFAWKLYFQLKDYFRLKIIFSAERLLSPEVRSQSIHTRSCFHRLFPCAYAAKIRQLWVLFP